MASSSSTLAPYLTLLALAVPAGLLAKRAVRRWMIHTYTGVLDLANLAKPRDGGKLDGTAVVCGGRCAARTSTASADAPS